MHEFDLAIAKLKKGALGVLAVQQQHHYEWCRNVAGDNDKLDHPNAFEVRHEGRSLHGILQLESLGVRVRSLRPCLRP